MSPNPFLNQAVSIANGKHSPVLAIVTPQLVPRVPPSTTDMPTSSLPFAIANAPSLQKLASISPPETAKPKSSVPAGTRLNKFVRRLHDMLKAEQKSGIVEWRRGLLVLHSTDAFAKKILPRYFNTRNFKTFRRQLNYYGFVHVRSFSTTGSATTALWVNQDLAQTGDASISSVLLLKRVEPDEAAKTAEGRRARKELAVSTVEDDIGVDTKTLQLDHIRSIALRNTSSPHHQTSSSLDDGTTTTNSSSSEAATSSSIPLVVHCHGVNGTTTTYEGGCSPSVLSGTPCYSWAGLEGPPQLVNKCLGESSSPPLLEDNASAAKLLLMLSKSSVARSA